MENISRQWWRVGGVAGVVWFVLMAIGLLLTTDTPFYDDPMDDIRAFWVDDGQKVVIGYLLLAIGFSIFYLPFLVALRTLLGRAEGGVQFCSHVAYLGGLMLVVVFMAGGAFWGVLAFGDFAERASDETLETLMRLDYYAFSVTPFFIGMVALFTSVVIATTGVLWKWLAPLGAVIAVISVLGPFGVLSAKSDDVIDFLWFISMTAGPIWVLLVSIAMVLRKEEPAAA